MIDLQCGDTARSMRYPLLSQGEKEPESTSRGGFCSRIGNCLKRLWSGAPAVGPKTYAFSAYVVDSSGTAPYQTIQNAVQAAILQGGYQTIVVRPGTYRENIDFSRAGKLTLLGAVALGDQGQCEIHGTHIPPTNGSLGLNGFRLSSDVHLFQSQAQGTAHLSLINIALSGINGYTFYLPNWQGICEVFNLGIYNPKSDGFVYNTGGAKIGIYSADVGAGTTHPMVCSGPISAQSISIACPVQLTGNSAVDFDTTIFKGYVDCNGNSRGVFRSCRFFSDQKAPFLMNSSQSVELYDSVIDSSSRGTVAIDGQGSGQLLIGVLTFPNGYLFASNLNLKGAMTTFGRINISTLTES